MAARIISDEEFRELKERIIRDKREMLAKGNPIESARNVAYGRLTAFAGTEKERAYTESQLEDLFEIIGQEE